MSLGSHLFNARKKRGLSQEEAAEKLGVSRQTISKWELDETLPDIFQAKKLAVLYHVTIDELMDFEVEVKEIEDMIHHTSEEVQNKIDWSKLWAKKYPILASYKKTVDSAVYAEKLRELLDCLKKDYHYSDMDAFLVLKDILANLWTEKN